MINLIVLNKLLTNMMFPKPLKNFTNNFSIVDHEKLIIFGDFDDFISNFTYYDLYWRKVEVLTRKKYAIRFFIRPLDFS